MVFEQDNPISPVAPQEALPKQQNYFAERLKSVDAKISKALSLPSVSLESEPGDPKIMVGKSQRIKSLHILRREIKHNQEFLIEVFGKLFPQGQDIVPTSHQRTLGDVEGYYIAKKEGIREQIGEVADWTNDVQFEGEVIRKDQKKKELEELMAEVEDNEIFSKDLLNNLSPESKDEN